MRRKLAELMFAIDNHSNILLMNNHIAQRHSNRAALPEMKLAQIQTRRVHTSVF